VKNVTFLSFRGGRSPHSPPLGNTGRGQALQKRTG